MKSSLLRELHFAYYVIHIVYILRCFYNQALRAQLHTHLYTHIRIPKYYFFTLPILPSFFVAALHNFYAFNTSRHNCCYNAYDIIYNFKSILLNLNEFQLLKYLIEFNFLLRNLLLLMLRS